MAVNAYFPNDLLEKKLLVVGAGGIGCELLKNLAMAGFQDVEVVDLDTIDVSNLNRQFLFRREHVGMSKAQVASDAARAMRPNMKIIHHHGSILDAKYNITFYQRFAVVLNALDNLAARRHVNRLCISARIPLIDGGTTGFLGQVRVIKRDLTECFDCVEHPVPKTFPTCTIRNTPSEFIHCITWSKYLFNQLFGKEDPDQDVAPMEETTSESNGEAPGPAPTDQSSEMEVGEGSAPQAQAEQKQTMNTRQFVELHKYDPQQLYNKLFVRDIEYLLSMEDLWKERRPPRPYCLEDLNTLNISENEPAVNVTWSLDTWINVFATNLRILAARRAQTPSEDALIWDKDDEAALRFVAACSNIRASIFNIPGRSLFEVKSMAGNIIPAIATSNAIVAGLMVVEAYKVIANTENRFQSSFIVLKPTVRGKIVVNDAGAGPNPKCYVCTTKREVFVRVNTAKMLQKTFTNKVLKEGIGMLAPDVTDMGTGRVLVNSEDKNENAAILSLTLTQLSIDGGAQLDCDDYNQQFNFKLFIVQDDDLDAMEYKIVSDSGAQQQPVAPAPEEEAATGKAPNKKPRLV